MSNVVPFTYRDGATFADILYGVRDYLVNTMVPGFELDITKLTEQLNSELGDMGREIIAGQERAQELHDVFTTEIERRVMAINNKTGAIDIQRVTLTDSNYIVRIDAAWPDNHPIDFVVTQDGAGSHDLNFSSEIYRSADLSFDRTPNSVTEFTLYPDGTGKWQARPSAGSGTNKFRTINLSSTPTVLNVSSAWKNTEPVHIAVVQDSTGSKTLETGPGISGTVILSPYAGSVTEITLLPDGNGAWIVAPQYALMDPGFNTAKVGLGALGKAYGVGTRNNNAFGSGALSNLTKGRYNDFFGLEAGFSVDGMGYTESTMHASRNSGFGSNTQRFNRTGWNNISMGRNSMQCNVSGTDNVALGAGSMSGLAPVGFGGIIELQLPMSISESVAVGVSTLQNTIEGGQTATGHRALAELVTGEKNTAFGRIALARLDTFVGPNGRTKVAAGWSVAYSMVTGELVVTYPGHGMQIGYMVSIKLPDHETQHLYVQQVDGTTFTLDRNGHMLDTTKFGSATLNYYMTLEKKSLNSYNTALGNNALGALEGGDAAYGSRANTALGFSALASMVDGTPATNLRNCVGLGASTQVSDHNQIAIGGSGHTAYAYQALQIRSDVRDKADIIETKLGLDFINRLTPVDYKFDMRADYFEHDEDGNVTSTGTPDGSKKRNRMHHGIIAQDVQKVIEETGIDFGGFQDHNVNGGSDVMTVGYEEFIAPLIKAVQELSAQVKELKGK